MSRSAALVICLVAVAVFSLATLADAVVTLPDPGLEAAIWTAIGKPAGDVLESDLVELTALDASSRSISDLTGVEHRVNLQRLDLPGNRISDLTPLARLTALTVLHLWENQISDLIPVPVYGSLGVSVEYNGQSPWAVDASAKSCAVSVRGPAGFDKNYELWSSSITIPGLIPGSYSVRLLTVLNCGSIGEQPATVVQVVANETAHVVEDITALAGVLTGEVRAEGGPPPPGTYVGLLVCGAQASLGVTLDGSTGEFLFLVRASDGTGIVTSPWPQYWELATFDFCVAPGSITDVGVINVPVPVYGSLEVSVEYNGQSPWAVDASAKSCAVSVRGPAGFDKNYELWSSSITIPGLIPGSYSVRLLTVLNCGSIGEQPATVVQVVANETAHVVEDITALAGVLTGEVRAEGGPPPPGTYVGLLVCGAQASLGVTLDGSTGEFLFLVRASDGTGIVTSPWPQYWELATFDFCVAPGSITDVGVIVIPGTSAPEMDVQGEGVSVLDGDSTPSAEDDTDFGSVDITAGTVDHTFTIRNTGTAGLNLTGSPRVVVGGTDASDFSVTLEPTSPVASGGGTTTFTVRFDPSTAGVRMATISIANDDADENPYDFAIQGTGTISTAGDIDGSGVVDVLDLRLVLQAALDLITLTPDQQAQADVDGDGDVDMIDVTILGEYLIGLRSTLP
jgi:hypothetical protein